MIKQLLRLLCALPALLAGQAGAQSSLGPSGLGPFYQPGWYQGYVPTPAQWANMWSNKVDYFSTGIPVQYGGTGATTKLGAAQNLGLLQAALPSGNIFVGNSLNTAAGVAPSGDLTTTNAGVFSVSNLSHVTNGSLANSGLANPSTTVNGVTCTLGSTCTITATATSITAGTTTLMGTTHANGLLYNAANVAANLATANNGVLVTDGSGVPSISTTLPNGLTMGATTFSGSGFNGGIGTFRSTTSANSVKIQGLNGVSIQDTAFAQLTDGTNNVFLGLTGTGAGGNVGRFRVIGANGFENFSVDTNGNVGIGISSPATKLAVAGTIGTNVGDVDPGTGAAMYIVGSGAFQTVIAGAAFAVNTGLNGARAERLRVDISGNVGIGTSSPGALLEVNGTAKIGGILTYMNGTAIPSGGLAGFGYNFFSTPNFGIYGGTGAPALSAAKGSLYLRNDNGAVYSNNNGTTGWTQLAAGGVSVTGTPVANQLATWNSSSAIQGLTAANNSVLQTDGSGVPSWVTALPSGITATTQAALDGSTKVATNQYADAAVAVGMPIGACVPYGGASAPTGWVLSFGQAISRTTFAALFAIYSTTFGIGDGSTTFNMPDLRGSVPVGKDNMGGVTRGLVTNAGSGITGTTLGATGGAQNHAHSASVTVSSTGSTSGNLAVSASGSGTTGGPSDGTVIAGTPADTNVSSATHTHNVSLTVAGSTSGVLSVATSGSGAGSTSTSANMPPTVIMNYICKTQ
jgi:microcystin-dependent protein